MDYFRVVAPTGTTTLDLSVVPAPGLDTYVELYNSSGTWFRTINNGGTGGTDSASSIPISAGATYYIGVSGFSRSQTGSYTVNVDFNPNQNSAPNSPTFFATPPGAVYPTKTYSVTVDYTDPDGQADLKHVYLRLSQADDENNQRQTLMHTIPDNWTGTWGGETHFTPSVSKVTITNGYRVTWTFTGDWTWPESTNVDFYAFAVDNGAAESSHVKNDRNALYENDLVISGSVENLDPVTLGQSYTVTGSIVFEASSTAPDNWSGISARMDEGAVGGTNRATDTSVSTGYALSWTPSAGDIGSHTLYVYPLNTNHQPPNNGDTYYDIETVEIRSLTITGRVTYKDVDGSMLPAKAVTVQVYERQFGPVPNEEIAEVLTGVDGYFTVTQDKDGLPISIADSGLFESGSRDLYFRVWAQNDAVKVFVDATGTWLDPLPLLDTVYHYESPVTDDIEDDTSGARFEYNMPLTSTGKTPNHAAVLGLPGYFVAVRDWFLGKTGYARPLLHVLYPNLLFVIPATWPGYNSKLDFIALPEDWKANNGEETIPHEYGHAIEHSLYGNRFPSAPDDYPNYDGLRDTEHVIFSQTSATTAMQEGWAEFLECAYYNDPDRVRVASPAWFIFDDPDNIFSWDQHANTNLESNSWWTGDDQGVITTVSLNPDGSRGHIVEGAVASILWDLWDGTGDDSVDRRWSDTWTALYNTLPTKIWSASPSDDFYHSWNNLFGRSRPVDEVFLDHGIPVAGFDDSYEENDSSGAAYALSNVQQTYPDLVLADAADWFKFTTVGTALAGSAVSLTFTNSRGNLDLYVYDAGLNSVGSSTTAGNTESVSMAGRPAGTYYVKVVGSGDNANTTSIYEGDFSPDYDLTLAVLVNHAPNISGLPDQILNEDGNLNNAIDLWAYASDQETADNGLSFSIIGNTNANCGVAIDSNRYIDIGPVLNWYGTSDVTVQVSDGQLASSDTFRITVNSVNDNPIAQIVSILPNPAQPPAQMVDFNGSSNDIDGTVVAWEWSSNLDGVLSTSEDFGKSSYTLTVGQHQISFRVRDNGSLWSTPATATLTVLNALPTAEISGVPINPVPPRSPFSVILGGYDNDENGQSIAVKELTLDGSVVYTGTAAAYVATAPSVSGPHNLSYRVKDDEGTWSDPVVRGLTVSAPTVTNVVIRGTAWASAFPFYDGYSIPVGSGAQLLTLPWVNIDQIKVVFSEDVDIDQADLVLSGVNGGQYDLTFTYDSGTFTATGTLPPLQAIGPDKLTIWLNADSSSPIQDKVGNRLDGEWTDTSSVYPSGNGRAGGNFSFHFNVLPGNGNQDGIVDIRDGLGVRDRLFASSNDPRYSPFYDFNGDGVINIRDGLIVRDHLFDRLPEGEPLSPRRSGLGIGLAAASEALFLHSDSIATVSAPTSLTGERPAANPSGVSELGGHPGSAKRNGPTEVAAARYMPAGIWAAAIDQVMSDNSSRRRSRRVLGHRWGADDISLLSELPGSNREYDPQGWRDSVDHVYAQHDAQHLPPVAVV